MSFRTTILGSCCGLVLALTSACGADGEGGAGGNTGGQAGNAGGNGGSVTGGSGGSATGGAGGAPASCGLSSFTPCGGDIVGVWTLDSFCPTPLTAAYAVDPACDDSGIVITGLSIEESATFNADGSYQRSGTYGPATETWTITNNCSSGSAGIPIANFCPTVENTILSLPGISSATCTLSDSVCTCVATRGEMASTESGTYVTDNGLLTTTDTGSTVTDIEYCVTPDRAELRMPPGTRKPEMLLDYKR